MSALLPWWSIVGDVGCTDCIFGISHRFSLWWDDILESLGNCSGSFHFFAFLRIWYILSLQMPSGSSLCFGRGNNISSSEIHFSEDFFIIIPEIKFFLVFFGHILTYYINSPVLDSTPHGALYYPNWSSVEIFPLHHDIIHFFAFFANTSTIRVQTFLFCDKSPWALPRIAKGVIFLC